MKISGVSCCEVWTDDVCILGQDGYGAFRLLQRLLAADSQLSDKRKQLVILEKTLADPESWNVQ